MTDTSLTNDRFRYLVLSAALMIFLLIVLGGILRVSDPSLSCPDWPTCQGQWLPPLRIDNILEIGHRLLTLISMPLVLLAAAMAWRSHRGVQLIRLPLTWAAALLVIQSLLGGMAVLGETPPDLIALHFGLALLILGLLIISTAMAFTRHQTPSQPDRLVYRSTFARSTIIAPFVLFAVLVSGTYLALTDAAYTCTGWPLCNGEWIPSHILGWVHMLHRAVVALGAVYMLALVRNAWRSQRSQRAILSAATLTAVLYFAQMLVGALAVNGQLPTYLLGLHVATAAAVWAMAVALVVLVGLAAHSVDDEAAEVAMPVDSRQRVLDLLSLTKPIIVALLLATTFSGMVVAAGSFPPLSLTLWTLLGGALAAGGSGAVNQYIDRELDQNMARTAKRPIASGRMTPAEGLAFGLSLLVISFYVFSSFVNMLAALLALAGMIYYIIIYSVWLKRATVQNIVIGGGAGAIPPMVGWAAATGRLDTLAFLLFAIIFLWTPPHFWALALIRIKDYANAGVPMLPVVRGEQVTRWQIFLYTLQLVALTLLLPFLGLVGIIYLYAAVILGIMLIYIAWKVWRVGGNKLNWRMYRYSSMYLALLFAALVVDTLL